MLPNLMHPLPSAAASFWEVRIHDGVVNLGLGLLNEIVGLVLHILNEHSDATVSVVTLWFLSPCRTRVSDPVLLITRTDQSL